MKDWTKTTPNRSKKTRNTSLNIKVVVFMLQSLKGTLELLQYWVSRLIFWNVWNISPPRSSLSHPILSQSLYSSFHKIWSLKSIFESCRTCSFITDLLLSKINRLFSDSIDLFYWSTIQSIDSEKQSIIFHILWKIFIKTYFSKQFYTWFIGALAYF